MTVPVGEVMTKNVVTCPADATLVDVAALMRDRDIGDVLVTDDDEVRGIVTDRDLVVRAMASGADPRATTVASVCTEDPATVTAETSLEEAERIMRERAVRRLPVVEAGRPVGILSLGDLAIERDGGAALADIAAAAPDD
jgi:CBS domain-containing protein